MSITTPAKADYHIAIHRDVKRVHHVESWLRKKPSIYRGGTNWKHAVLWNHRRRHWNHKWTPWTPMWFTQSQCIHQHEGAYNDATGNGYFGGFQFLPSTWASVNPEGYPLPNVEPPHIQRLLAWRVWRRDGDSWREWGTAGICGLS